MIEAVEPRRSIGERGDRRDERIHLNDAALHKVDARRIFAVRGAGTLLPGPCPAGYRPSDYATSATPVVLVGGVKAAGVTSILDPTYPGLYLVYFTVPVTAPKGNAVPVQVQIPSGPSTDPACTTSRCKAGALVVGRQNPEQGVSHFA